MPNPTSILTFFPTDDFKSRIPEKIEAINIYVDLKNLATGLYVDDIVNDIIYNSKHKKIDTTIFQSIIYLLMWWKKYLYDLNKPVKFYIFTDSGKSIYHSKINKNYKLNRHIKRINMPEDQQDIFEIRDKNFQMAEKVLNRFKDIYFFNLKNLESDFIPYYVMQKRHRKEELHVILSCDKDMFQCFEFPNVVQVSSRRNNIKVITKNNYLFHYLSLSKDSQKVINTYTQLFSSVIPEEIVEIMAMTGDVTDDVPGLPGIGTKKALKYFVENKQEIKNVLNDTQTLPTKNKVISENSETLKNAYKMISYNELCKWLEEENNLFEIEMNKYLTSILDKDNNEEEYFINNNVLRNILTKLDDLYLYLDDLQYI